MTNNNNNNNIKSSIICVVAFAVGVLVGGRGSSGYCDISISHITNAAIESNTNPSSQQLTTTSTPTPTVATTQSPLLNQNTDGQRSLKDIGMSIRSDKIEVHHYDVPYEIHFNNFRQQSTPIKLLEIGLGCLGLKDIGLGVRLWGEYFKSAQMDVIEYDSDCGKSFENRNNDKRWGPSGGVRFHYGDQSNKTFLEKVGREFGPWDVIIDDGSHQSDHQIISFETLFPFVKSGGKYIIEDLQLSFSPGVWGNNGTAVYYIGTEIFRRVQTRIKSTGHEELDTKLRSPFRSIDCHHFMCVITKR
eukprot:TRINITY_DN3472_c0_g1_i2.p1 TRINITY_DN3472_c0_g1~~TRINITY_DN3472_c0_g1_i2.p1  ORF type:complete len:317 (+),score=70.79 TRINITY_DN3472_c0_g1_i2:47-952(+)